jgi:hypothetical protein
MEQWNAADKKLRQRMGNGITKGKFQVRQSLVITGKQERENFNKTKAWPAI